MLVKGDTRSLDYSPVVFPPGLRFGAQVSVFAEAHFCC